MKENETKDVVIIGAGITGLTLAFYLQKAGKKVTIIDQSDHVGGVIQTKQENGFIFETGPNTGVLSTPELVELFEDNSEAELETANSDSKNRWILKNNHFHAIPSGLIGGITTPLFSLKDKFRILGEPWRKPGTNPHETLAQLVKRRMGKSFLDYAVDPFISGIYAGDPNKLIPKYALPKLYNLEQKYGSFIRGAIQKKKEPKTDRDRKATKEVFSAFNGLQHLTDTVAKNIGSENIQLGAHNTTIEPHESGFKTSWSTETETFVVSSKKVVTTVPAPSIEKLLPFIDKNLTKPITDLTYAKVVQVVLGFKDWDGRELNAFGGLIPKLEQRKVLGILFPSSIFKNRAPESGALLSVFMGGMRHPDIIEQSDEQLLTLAKNTVNETLKARNEPELAHVFRYKHAIPQYTETTPERINAIESIEQQYPGLILAGNIRDGIGMADRVKQAVDLSKKLTS
ncbi:protoporphyrinogen oxidase [Salinivirga cyanobacteriivorans]